MNRILCSILARKREIVYDSKCFFVFVAKLDIASDSDSEGRGFESRRTQEKYMQEEARRVSSVVFIFQFVCGFVLPHRIPVLFPARLSVPAADPYLLSVPAADPYLLSVPAAAPYLLSVPAADPYLLSVPAAAPYSLSVPAAAPCFTFCSGQFLPPEDGERSSALPDQTAFRRSFPVVPSRRKHPFCGSVRHRHPQPQ